MLKRQEGTRGRALRCHSFSTARADTQEEHAKAFLSDLETDL